MLQPRDKFFSQNYPVYSIAEAGTGHGGDLDKALAFVERASTSGASAVKFQWVLADEIIHPLTPAVDLPGGSTELYQKFKQVELSEENYKKILSRCQSLGIDFLCSAFGPNSAKSLLNLIGQEAIVKIASPELNYWPMVDILLESANPLMVSTGVSLEKDIHAFTERYKRKRPKDSNLNQLILLQCVTHYPALEDEYQLAVQQQWFENYACLNGLSDHTKHPHHLALLFALWSWKRGRAFIWEKHLSLDTAGTELDDSIALTAEELSLSLARLREAFEQFQKKQIQSMSFASLHDEMTYYRENFLAKKDEQWIASLLKSTKKTLSLSEKKIYRSTNRSLLATEDIPVGAAVLPGKNCAFLRSEGLEPGLTPEDWEKCEKDKAAKTILNAQAITPELLER